MPAGAPVPSPPGSPTVTAERRFARLAWIVLAVNVVVILWGAVVRVTGSGAGCGNDWPLCNDAVVPVTPTAHTLIELSHRLTSGLALILVVALAVVAWRRFPARHPVRAAAALSLVFILIEAAIGAGLVLFDLVGDDDSATRAVVMGAHLCNTFLLLAALAGAAHWATDERRPRLAGRRLAGLSLAALAATLLVGLSGGVAALGDTLYPPGSHGETLREGLLGTSHLLVQLRLLHPVLAFAGAALLLYLVARVRAVGDRTARRWATALNWLVLVQLAVGSLNVALYAPAWMQVLHLLVADLLWIALFLTCVTALAAEEPAPLRRSVLAGA